MASCGFHFKEMVVAFKRLIFWRLSHAQFFLACYLNNIIRLPCVQYEVSYMIWSPLKKYLNKINKFHFKLMRRTMTQGSFLLDFKFVVSKYAN
jgi:hypothetical protein